jgi:hypothetical protein
MEKGGIQTEAGWFEKLMTTETPTILGVFVGFLVVGQF